MPNNEIVYFVNTTKELYNKELNNNTVHDNFIYFVKNSDSDYKLYKGKTELTINNDYITKQIKDLIGNAPEELNTLKELADAFKGNEKLIKQINEAIVKKADKAYLDKKLKETQDKLISGSNIKTINRQDILGSGNIQIKEMPDIRSDISDFLKSDISEEYFKNKYGENNQDEMAQLLYLESMGLWFPGFNFTNGNKEFKPMPLGVFFSYLVETIDENTTKKIDNKADKKELEEVKLLKQDKLTNGVNIKTLNGYSILGSGNLDFKLSVQDVRGLQEELSDLKNNKKQNEFIVNETNLIDITSFGYCSFIGTNTIILDNMFYQPNKIYQIEIKEKEDTICKINLYKNKITTEEKSYFLSSKKGTYYLNIKKTSNENDAQVSITLTDKTNYNGYDIKKSVIKEIYI